MLNSVTSTSLLPPPPPPPRSPSTPMKLNELPPPPAQMPSRSPSMPRLGELPPPPRVSASPSRTLPPPPPVNVSGSPSSIFELPSDDVAPPRPRIQPAGSTAIIRPPPPVGSLRPLVASPSRAPSVTPTIATPLRVPAPIQLRAPSPKPVALAPLQEPPSKIDVGEIRGRACDVTVEIVRVPLSIEYRTNLAARVTCEAPVLTVQDVRGSGTGVEVLLAIDSRHSMTAPFHVTVEGSGKTIEADGTVVIDRPTPFILGMQTICGGEASADCPIMEAFWARKAYHAFFEPKLKEFRISQSKGFIEAGAKVFPFKVFFAPKDPRPIEANLVVDCGDMEITVKVCGSTGGFQGRRWGERKH
jgi:hypothetical protein